VHLLPSGRPAAAKTTTLRMLAGFEDLDEGEILVGDRVISSSFKNYYLPPEKRDIRHGLPGVAVWPHSRSRQRRVPSPDPAGCRGRRSRRDRDGR